MIDKEKYHGTPSDFDRFYAEAEKAGLAREQQAVEQYKRGLLEYIKSEFDRYTNITNTRTDALEISIYTHRADAIYSLINAIQSGDLDKAVE